MKNLGKAYCLSFILIIVYVFCFSSVYGQKKQSDEEVFQNKQRALSLSFYKNQIKNLEDAPIRCFARSRIAQFILSKKVKEFFETAETLAIDCFEDIKKNPEQFSRANKSSVTGRLISELRVNMPEVAEEIELKYSESIDQFFSNFREIDLLENTSNFIQRLENEIKRGKIPSFFVLYKLRKKNPVDSIRLLDLILRHYELIKEIKRSDNTFVFLYGEYFKKDIPIGMKKRHLLLIIEMSEKVLMDKKNPYALFTLKAILNKALPHIKEILPSMYQRALAIKLTMEGSETRFQKEEREIYKRIERSENKLEQTIIEAKSAKRKNLKSGLWKSAAKIAIKEKKFRLAVECIKKYEITHPNPNFNQNYLVQFLTTDILPTVLKEKRFEDADFVVENTPHLNGKAVGLNQIANSYLKQKDQILALEKINEAIRILKKAENDIHKVRNLFSASRLATRIENANPFEIADEAIETINRLPLPDLKDQTKNKTRQKYVATVLLPNAFNIFVTFRNLAFKDHGFAYPMAKKIQRRDLQLIAEIAVEMEKKYPYTPQNEKEAQK
jgi:hypothetical protein